MKYSIEGIEKGKTIKSVQVVDGIKATGNKETMLRANAAKIVMVDYLDGTQDVFEFDEATINRIQSVVDAQAKVFVEKSKAKFPLWGEINAVISGLCTATAYTFYPNLMGMIIGAAGTIFFLGNAIRIGIKNQNIKKHEIYVSRIMGKLDEYRNILEKEKYLSKTNSKHYGEPEKIINIDKKTISELEYIGNKVERYQYIEGKSPKVKSL